jgi:hypothetical protein
MSQMNCLVFYADTSLFFHFFIDCNRDYNRIHLIFLEHNPTITLFDIYCPSCDFFKDSPQFHSISIALSAALTSVVNKQKTTEGKDVEVLLTCETHPKGTK